MEIADLAGVVRVARDAFPHHFEDPSCFAERLQLYPGGCFALDDGSGAVAGYLIAYPWTSGSVPPVNSLIGSLPLKANQIYLHDLALHRDVQGRGLARPIVDRLVCQARKGSWDEIALVAVNRAAPFWTKLGFALGGTKSLYDKLASYGADARYMVRQLAK